MTTPRPDPLVMALRWALVRHRLAIEERDLQRTELTWPTHHDIYNATIDTIRRLCSGDLDPEQWLQAERDKDQGRHEVSSPAPSST